MKNSEFIKGWKPSENSTNVFKRKRSFKKGIDKQIVDEYLNVLEESDFRQYANITSSLDDKQIVFDQARKILTQLVKWI